MALETSLTQRASWKDLTREGAVILLSILAAFAIDAGWQLSQERARLQTVLASLERGLVEHLALIDYRVERVTRDQRRLRNFIRADPGEVSDIQPDSTSRVIQSLYRSHVDDVNITFLLATLEGASLDLLRAPLLEEAIAVWRLGVDNLAEQDVQLLSVAEESLRAVSRHPGVRLGLTTPLVLSTDPNRLFDTGGLIYDGDLMRRVREDERVMTAATVKSYRSKIHLRALYQVREAAESVLTTLRSARDQ